ncbi:MAG: hypothetical protein LBE18_06895 [Planctomycetaceae bacterium]|jgi:hypothetical protein|nr:hypothetical protein [Planctomycetaceae bacterium]
MSVTGAITLFTKRDDFDNIYALLDQSLAIFELETNAQLSYCTEDVHDEWAMFQRLRDGIDTDFHDIDVNTCFGETNQVNVDFVNSIDFSKKTLTLWTSDAQLPDIFGDLIDNFPQDIITDGLYQCRVTSVGVSIGYQDIYTPYEAQNNEDGIFFGRAFYRFCINLHNSANDCKVFRRLVRKSPEFKELKRKLESFAGKLNDCIYWE